MKFGVVVFPGSNCDRDVIDALQYDLKQHVIRLWHKDEDLSQFEKQDCIILPGGFSYGDYLRCGAIARFSPMMKSVTRFAQDGGNVFGICNGFQILCESGLLPGVLLRNANMQFVCRNIYIKSEQDENEVIKVPVAHGEGRYFADDDTLKRLNDNRQILYRYCDSTGNILEENPNGSAEGIAGICNESGNIFGMMPHPERACSKLLGNEDGKKIFSRLFSVN